MKKVIKILEKIEEIKKTKTQLPFTLKNSQKMISLWLEIDKLEQQLTDEEWIYYFENSPFDFLYFMNRFYQTNPSSKLFQEFFEKTKTITDEEIRNLKWVKKLLTSI